MENANWKVNELHEANITVHANQECSTLTDFPTLLPPENICAGGNGTTLGEGDSGGPLQCRIPDSSPAKWQAMGIGTIVTKRNITKRPSIFNSVRRAMPWIADVYENKYEGWRSTDTIAEYNARTPEKAPTSSTVATMTSPATAPPVLPDVINLTTLSSTNVVSPPRGVLPFQQETVINGNGHRMQITSAEWPWQATVSVGYGGKDGFCGGTIIGNRWILTSATCVRNISDPSRNVETEHVMVSLGDRYAVEKDYDNSPVMRRTLAKFIAHPGYIDKFSARLNVPVHEIALLKLKETQGLNHSFYVPITGVTVISEDHWSVQILWKEERPNGTWWVLHRTRPTSPHVVRKKAPALFSRVQAALPFIADVLYKEGKARLIETPSTPGPSNPPCGITSGNSPGSGLPGGGTGVNPGSSNGGVTDISSSSRGNMNLPKGQWQ
ncbi:hypothetical protein RvY_12364 [Ramazzottius varieornatus]|uniref:Peptidase S1 domain-containing protein n=1 Tax=Ramazzottius varieornatus TaxID=947166 RepID=A0A1D1VL96_RAMVA|nr:hypothetical protein RvY_12364 [Ramazzottius varieornatus]